MDITNETYNLEIKKANETLTSTDVWVQCSLGEESKQKVQPQFTIKDIQQRRRLVRNIYGLLILHHLVIAIGMEISLHLLYLKNMEAAYGIIGVTGLLILLIVHFLRRIRRKMPMNYIFFIFVFIMGIGWDICYAQMYRSHSALLKPLCLVGELIFLILFTKQECLRFTNFRAFMVMLSVCVLYFITILIWPLCPVFEILCHALIFGIYIVHNTQMMLTGQHGYNLEPNEHIFATTNIYAEWPLCIWHIFKFFFLDHIIAMAKFIKKCCKSDVC